LRLQQEQQLRARNPQDARTPEQAETREFVRQWAQGPPPPRQTGPTPAHNQTQSKTTGLINDFNKINIDPIATVMAQLGVSTSSGQHKTAGKNAPQTGRRTAYQNNY